MGRFQELEVMKKDSRTLLVFNYAMDSQNPIFSHQVEAVTQLAEYFNKVVVITSSTGGYNVPNNVVVKSSEWLRGKPFRNVLNLLRTAIPELNKDLVIFFHMTDVQAAIISPIARLIGIKQHLWYAHTSYSIYLRWSKLWLSSIISSTAGSCPVKGSKVVIIGQAINPKFFCFRNRKSDDLESGIHIGRFDPSKRIEHLISESLKIREFGFDIKVTQIGSPSGDTFESYHEKIKSLLAELGQSGWFTIKDSVNRALIPDILHRHDFFIHAFNGSLDKTLIEATMCGLPVLTTNQEYMREFGSWTGDFNSTLSEQYRYIVKMDPAKLNLELSSRYRKCLEFHSISHWQTQLATQLKSF